MWLEHVGLLGDSIFDNASYAPGKPADIETLRHQLGKSWEATRLDIDGIITSDVQYQIKNLPDDATHLVIKIN